MPILGVTAVAKELVRDAKYLQLAWRMSADLTMNHRPVSEGAAGVGMGRNIFQSGDPIAMIQAVGKVVHERLQPKQAYEFYEDAKSAQGAHSLVAR
jgi:3-hydroxy-5-phosphonooxypentane-2,4-dione thiolase